MHEALDQDQVVDQDRLAQLIGIEDVKLGPEFASARVPVTNRVQQPYGVVHGGAFSVIAETLCSAATHSAVADDGMIALGQSNDARFLRPISDGAIHAEAIARHRGRTTWIWDCELKDDAGRLCALVRMTVAVRPAPQP